MHLQLRCQVKRLFDVRLLCGRKCSKRANEFYAGHDILKCPRLSLLKGTARGLHGIVQLPLALQVLGKLDHQFNVVGRGAPVGSVEFLRQQPKSNRLRALKHVRGVLLVAKFKMCSCDVDAEAFWKSDVIVVELHRQLVADLVFLFPQLMWG